MKVIKRDGTKQEFDSLKIRKAIQGAWEDILEEDANINDSILDDLTNKVLDKLDQRKNYTVEQIQDLVELTLMENDKFNIAKAFIEYRQLHKMARNRYNDFMEAVANKLGTKEIENQNANVDEHSFGGRMGMANNLLTKQFALDYCMSKKSKENHLNNEIYIHDLDSYAVGMHNCLSIPFDNLLAKGFKTRQTDVRPAGSVNTAMQLVAVIFQLQSLQQFGGVSATHLDWTMVPYVRKSFAKHYKDGLKYIDEFHINQRNNEIDYEIEYMLNNSIDYSIEDSEYKAYSEKAYKYAIDMTNKEIHQAVEALYHNLNTLQSRSGNQLPFTSINYGTCTLLEGRMIIKNLLEVSIEGLGKFHKTSIFPCSIFQLMKGVNRKPSDPNYDLFQLALKSTAQRLYPNYVNCDWTNNAGYDKNDPKQYVSTMGCRTYNGYDINGLGFQKDGRGNLAPVTIILPTLAMEANKDIEKFILLLDTKLNEAKDMLIERYEYMCKQSFESARFMYENNTMMGYNPKEGIRSALKHGTLAIGQVGLAETLQLLVNCDQTEEKGMQLAKRIEQLYKDRCDEFKEKYKLNFGVYMTPAENLCFTAMTKFKEKYGVIPKVSDRDYFTNSIHVPVWKKMTPFEKIDIEGQLTGYSNAGCITYVELESSVKHNLKALETIINYAMDKDIPYFAINIPNDQCMNCGYLDEINNNCPQCNSTNIQRLRRVTGYLSQDYHNFNKGKIAEVEDRIKHSKEMKDWIR